MATRTRNEILEDHLESLTKERELKVTKYIVPLDIEIRRTKQKMRDY